MYEKTVEITNTLGIHARPASQIVRAAGEFVSDIVIAKEGMEVNGKSIMGILMLACEQGSRVTIRANGPDEKEAVETIVELIERKFDEE